MPGYVDSYNLVLAAGVPVAIQEPGQDHRPLDVDIDVGSLADVFIGSEARQLAAIPDGTSLTDLDSRFDDGEDYWDLNQIYLLSDTGGSVNILLTKNSK